MLLRDLFRTHRGVMDDVRGLRTALEEAAALDDPMIAVGLELACETHAGGITLLPSNFHRLLAYGSQADLVPNVGPGERLLEGALEIDTPDGAIAALRLKLHEVRHGLARVMPVSRPAVIDETAGQELLSRRRRRLHRPPGRGAWRYAVFRRCRRLACHRTRDAPLLEFTRAVTPHLKAYKVGCEPGFFTKALGSTNRDLAPPARLGDLDEAADDLGVLAGGGQSRTAIREGARAVVK